MEKITKLCKKPTTILLAFVIVASIFVVNFNSSYVVNQQKAQAVDWYNYDWGYRSKITIDHTKVAAALTDFPVLISSTNTDWATTINGGKVEQSAGQDFVFIASDQTTKLSHEIEFYNATSGNLIAWVKIPTLSSSADTDIYLYFGNSSCSDQQNKNDVWSNGYKQSYHMGETSWTGTANEVKNSVSSNYNGQAYGGATTTNSGKIGYSGSFTSSSSQYFQVAQTNDFDIPTSGSATMQGWIKTSQTDRSMYFGYYNSSGSYFWIENVGNGNIALNTRGTGFERGATKSGTYNDGNWHYVVGVLEQSGSNKNWTVYVDGQSGTTNTLTTTGGLVWSKPLAVGAIYNDTAAGFFFNGQIDEYRYSLVARSSSWISTEYANQSSPETFYSVKTTETGDSTPPTNPTIINGYNGLEKTVNLINNNWAFYSSPYFEFSGADDEESGIKGYYIYFGADSEADPITVGNYQAHSGESTAVQHYAVSSTLTTGTTYYLRLVTENNATGNSNKSGSETLFIYKYDNVAPNSPEYINVSPVGCSTSSSFTFTWPEGSDNGGSSLAGYQYRNGSNGEIKTTADLTVSVSSYQEGDNIFYIRSYDNAGNTGNWQTSVYCSTATVNIVDGPTVSAGPSSITVNWISNKATTGYVKVYEGNTYISEQGLTNFSLTHSVKVIGLEPEKAYRYQITWTDQSGNLGETDWYKTNTAIAPQINNFKIEVLSPTALNVSWSSTISARFSLEYGIENYGTIIASENYLTGYSSKISNLVAGSTYQFRVNATGEDGTKFFAGESVVMPPMPSIGNLRFEPIKDRPDTAVKVSWDTNVELTSSVYYGLKGDSKKEISKSDKVKNHEIVVGELSDNSEYEIYAAGIDQYGNVAKSNIQTFKTEYDSRPPKIDNISTESSNVASGKTDTAQITVGYTTDEPAKCFIDYGTGISGSNYTGKTVEDDILQTNHISVISNLMPQTPHHFKVTCIDRAGNRSESSDQTVISGEITPSVFNIILKTLNNLFGWLGKVVN